jgi:hypothetical protein
LWTDASLTLAAPAILAVAGGWLFHLDRLGALFLALISGVAIVVQPDASHAMVAARTTTAAAARFTASRATIRNPRTPARRDGSRDGISPIRATSSSGACPAAEVRSEARTSRSNDS